MENVEFKNNFINMSQKFSKLISFRLQKFPTCVIFLLQKQEPEMIKQDQFLDHKIYIKGHFLGLEIVKKNAQFNFWPRNHQKRSVKLYDPMGRLYSRILSQPNWWVGQGCWSKPALYLLLLQSILAGTLKQINLVIYYFLS